jgi:alkylated DNA repair dioxygenase AlkB
MGVKLAVASLLCAAGRVASSTSRRLSPSLQLQRASTPADILRVATTHADRIAPRPLADSVLRVANALKQPEHADARAAVRSCADSLALVSRIARADPTPSTSVTLLRALALLGCSSDSRANAAERQAIELLVAHACAAPAGSLSIGELTALDWSARKLGADLPISVENRARLGALPFAAHCSLFARAVPYEALEAELLPHLRREEILLSDSHGERLVPEARLTGWWSRAGVPFAYSGKSMVSSVPDASHFAAMRERVAEASGIDYDGCLINMYPHGKAGMRYHQDPDVGTLWSSDTHVVSFGCTRTFILRLAADHNVRHEFTLEHGDVVHMFGICQREYQHCVRVERDEVDAGPRISLVFKKSLR